MKVTLIQPTPTRRCIVAERFERHFGGLPSGGEG